jgi:hypothetical protein
VARVTVQVGQYYREVGPAFWGWSMRRWSVERVFIGTDAIEYASLLNALDPSLRKTLSLTVLSDRRRFILE